MSDPWAEFTPAPSAAPAPAPQAAPAADPWAEFTPAPAAAPTPGVRFAQPAPQVQPDTTTDVAKSTGVGLVKGSTGLVGAPGTAIDAIGNGAEYLMERGANAVGLMPQGYQPRSYSDIAAENRQINDGTNILPRTADMDDAIQRRTGAYYQPQTTAGRYAETVAEFVPGAALMGGGPVSNIVRGAVAPGVASEAAGEATTGTGYEPWARLGASLAAPSALAAGRRVVTPLPVSPERQAMVDTLRSEGVPLTAGQVTGNKPLRYAESVLGDTPFSGGKAAAIDDAQKAAYTAAALRRLGIDSESAAPEVLASAKKALGAKFDSLASSNTVNFDHAFAQDLAQVQSEYHGLTLPNQQAPIVQKTLDDLMGSEGSMAGTKYQAVRSNLDKAGRAIAQSNPPLSQALFGIRNALDGAMTRSVTGEDAAAWADVRNKWKNWKVIEKASTMAGENAAQGNISPQALRSATAGQNRGAYAVGQGDYADLARSGTAIMSPLPQSGTAPRMAINNILGGLGAFGGAHAGGLEGAIGGALMAGAAPAVMSRGLMSTPIQAYLGNQMMSGGRPASALEHLLLGAPPVSDAMRAHDR